MTRSTALVALFVLSSSIACNEEESLSESVRSFNDELAAQAQIWCECHEMFGYDSTNDCMNSYAPLGPSQERCLEEALSRDEGSARAWLECVLPLEEEYTTCLNAQLVCDPDEIDGVDRCADDYNVGREECIELPVAVDRAIDDCFPD
jgi:hypothetical protein